jgi:glycosyltransferase involved in cell wall biosynthesis
MWRLDKNFLGAIKIIENLASDYKNVGFYIGRKNSWGDLVYSPPYLRKEYNEFCKIVKRKALNNIFLIKSMPQPKYWEFISCMDIGFSVSYHESFGISMLEQAAAGIACVMPNELSYKEVFKRYKGLVDRERIQTTIELLIKDKNLRQKLQQDARKCASKFKIENTIAKLIKLLERIIC